MPYRVISVEKSITITDHLKNIDIRMLNRRNTSTAVLSVTSYSGPDFSEERDCPKITIVRKPGFPENTIFRKSLL